MQDPLIGTTLANRYRIIGRLGAGAMGAVYRAEQLDLGRTVALKAIVDADGASPDVAARFGREARAMSALTHPNTVRVYDYGATAEGVLFLSMELLQGEMAGDRLARGAGPGPAEGIEWTRQILASLSEAHDKGIIHRDIKPDNLFLAAPEQGRSLDATATPIVKVLDFGIAKSITGEFNLNQFETQDGTVFGTPRYMSPEQCRGQQLDQRSDLYAVGIVLYELLAGHPPFVDKDAVVVMAQHIREPPPIPTTACDGTPLPGRLQAALAKALAKDPAARFQSTDEFDEELSACLALLDDGARRATRISGIIGRGQGLWNARVVVGAVAACLGALTFALWPADPQHTGEHASTQTSEAVPSQAPEPRASVTVRSTPAGAEVVHEGKVLGQTPYTMQVPEGRSMRVRLRMEGFEARTLDLTSGEGMREITLTPSRPTPGPGEVADAQEGLPSDPGAEPASPVRKKPRKSPYEKF